MSNALADRIRILTLDKIEFSHADAVGVVDGLVSSALSLDDAADFFTLLAGDDTAQEKIANALVNLGDLFDDVNLSPDQRALLDSVVDDLLVAGTQEQKQAAKDLFSNVLDFGLKAKAGNAFFELLLDTEPE